MAKPHRHNGIFVTGTIPAIKEGSEGLPPEV
jgi:hypothetical protein